MRPIRDLQEDVTDMVPRGPLGFAGDGNLVGAAGMVGVSLARTVVPLSEFEPGYSVVSSERDKEDGKVKTTLRINAYSRDVAQFIGKRRSAPSNVDFLIKDVEVKSVEPVEERSTVTEWEVVTETEDR